MKKDTINCSTSYHGIAHQHRWYDTHYTDSTQWWCQIKGNFIGGGQMGRLHKKMYPNNFTSILWLRRAPACNVYSVCRPTVV